MMMAEACRVLDLVIELVRSSKGATLLSAPLRRQDRSRGGCRMQTRTDRNPCKHPVSTGLTGDFLLRSAPCGRGELALAAALHGPSRRAPRHRIDTFAQRRRDRPRPLLEGAVAAPGRVGGAARSLCGRVGARRARAELQQLEARSAELERDEQSDETRPGGRPALPRRVPDPNRNAAARPLCPGRAGRDRHRLRRHFARGGHTGIDGLERATSLNERLRDAGVVEGEATGPRAETARLPACDARRRPCRGAGGRSAVLALAVAAKQASVSSVRQQRTITEAQLQALQAQARQAQQRSDEITAAATPTAGGSRASVAQTATTTPAAPTPSPSPSGTRTLVVDAVAYHLRGMTASGLPVGVGVIAVDPERDPARHARARARVRPRGRRRRRQRGPGQHHRPLDAEQERGARVGSAHRHDHDLRLSR